MEYRQLGRTGLLVSALALGTVELGLDYGVGTPGENKRPAETEAIRIVHAALDSGINLIDTARIYGDSEAILGRALRNRRQQVVLATKVRTQGDEGLLTGKALADHMMASLETSLRLLQTDYVDIWQIHNVDDALLSQIDVVSEVFQQAKQHGKAHFTGSSSYGTQIPLQALETGVFDVLQVAYSVLDQRMAGQVFPQAQASNVGIVARSILLKGVLTDLGDQLPSHLEPLRIRSRQFRNLIVQAGLDLLPAQVAIAFGLAQPQIGSVLIGVRSVGELHEDLQALQIVLPDPLLAQLYALGLEDADLLNPSTWGIP